MQLSWTWRVRSSRCPLEGQPLVLVRVGATHHDAKPVTVVVALSYLSVPEMLPTTQILLRGLAMALRPICTHPLDSACGTMNAHRLHTDVCILPASLCWCCCVKFMNVFAGAYIPQWRLAIASNHPIDHRISRSSISIIENGHSSNRPSVIAAHTV